MKTIRKMSTKVSAKVNGKKVRTSVRKMKKLMANPRNEVVFKDE